MRLRIRVGLEDIAHRCGSDGQDRGDARTNVVGGSGQIELNALFLRSSEARESKGRAPRSSERGGCGVPEPARHLRAERRRLGQEAEGKLEQIPSRDLLRRDG